MQRSEQSPILGASACLFRGEDVLLIQRGKPPRIGTWSLPGGHVEWGETTKAAAMRELWEETGLSAELPHFVGLYDIFRGDSADNVTAHFAIACHAGTNQSGTVIAATDAMAARWVSESLLQDYDLASNILDAITTARKLLRV